MTQGNSGSSSKLSTGNGLRAWLFFLFCFFFLGYSVPLSILFGAVAGLATALVFGWWKTKDDPSELTAIPESPDPEDIQDTPPPQKVSGLRSAHQRNTKSRNRSQTLTIPFRQFFDRSNSSRKSR
jgi:hypothetical protein